MKIMDMRTNYNNKTNDKISNNKIIKTSVLSNNTVNNLSYYIQQCYKLIYFLIIDQIIDIYTKKCVCWSRKQWKFN